MNSLSVKSVLDAVWLVSTLLLATNITLIYRRGYHREYPWFFRYLVLVLGRSPLLYALRQDEDAYFYGYWALEAVTVLLSFLVIYEIYQHVAGSSSLSISRATFFSVSVGFMALAAVAALMMDTPPGAPLVKAIMVLTHTVRTMQVGLLVLLMVASLFFNFYWQSLPFGFAMGYGVYAAIELCATAIRTSFGLTADPVFRLGKVLGYQVALLVWVTFVWRQRETHALDRLPEETMTEWLPVTERQSR